MKLSIIIPIYNREKTLPRCLDSLLAMKMSDYEVLMVDDGSTDSSEIICKEYERLDTRFHYFHKENGGVSSARNFGISNSSGIWITFVDSDDFVQADHFECLDERQTAQYDFLMTGVSVQPTNGGGKNIDIIGNKQIVNRYFSEKFSANLVYLVTNKCFLHRIIAEKCIHFPVEISLGEDQIFVCQYLKYVQHCLYIDQYTYCLCVGSLDGLTNRKRSIGSLYASTKGVFVSLFLLSIKTKSRATLVYSFDYLFKRIWRRFIKRFFKMLILKNN